MSSARAPDEDQDRDRHRADAGFEALWCRQEQPLRRYCRFLAGDRDDAEDLTQIVAVRALVALRAGASPRNERAWLWRIAHNEAISRHRARRLSGQLDPEYPARSGDPLAALLAAELVVWLLERIRRLAPQDRAILLMSELLDRSRGEIADALGIAPVAVTRALSRARAALRAEREAREGGEPDGSR